MVSSESPVDFSHHLRRLLATGPTRFSVCHRDKITPHHRLVAVSTYMDRTNLDCQ